jgi:hypothetical protein
MDFFQMRRSSISGLQDLKVHPQAGTGPSFTHLRENGSLSLFMLNTPSICLCVPQTIMVFIVNCSIYLPKMMSRSRPPVEVTYRISCDKCMEVLRSRGNYTVLKCSQANYTVSFTP